MKKELAQWVKGTVMNSKNADWACMAWELTTAASGLAGYLIGDSAGSALAGMGVGAFSGIGTGFLASIALDKLKRFNGEQKKLKSIPAKILGE